MKLGAFDRALSTRALSITSALSLVLAVAGGAYFYPNTYGQQDLSWFFGAILTVGSVIFFSLFGLCFAILALRQSKAASPFPWFLYVLCAAHLFLCIGVPLAFALRYIPNQPLDFFGGSVS